MTLNNPTLSLRRKTFGQTIASLFRSAANRLEGEPVAPPRISEIRKGLKYDVEVALLDAEAELERYSYTVAMLRERLGRLSDDTRYPTAPLPVGADRGVTARAYDETRIERRDSL